MRTKEIDVLTPRTLRNLLKSTGHEDPREGRERRRAQRWPFPGTAELWLEPKTAEEVQEYRLATCVNLNFSGVGLCCDEPLQEGQEVSLAMHQPAISLCGRAIVRHCRPVGDEYYAGLEFVFPPTVSSPSA